MLVSRKAFAASVLLLSLSAVSILAARTKTHRNPQADRDYVSALGTADHFLQAWLIRDHESGLLLLADQAKDHTSAERLEQYFSPESSSRRAYQIGRGRKLRAGRYTFPVVLFEDGTAAPRTRNSQIVIVRSSNDDWVVERIP